MSGVSDLFVNLGVAIMLLFFMLLEGRQMEHYVSSLLPFEEQNKREVLGKVELMVRSNAIGIPLLAVIQGVISFGGYLLSGAPNPVLSAMLTAFASIIPIVGTALVWIPITVYFLVVSDWVSAVVMLAYGGIVISQCDNLIRFILQKKDGKRASADHDFRSGGRLAAVRFHGSDFRAFARFPVPAVPRHVPQRSILWMSRGACLVRLSVCQALIEELQDLRMAVGVKPADVGITLEPCHLLA